LRGEVWTIWTDEDVIIGWDEVYKYTNLLRKVSDEEVFVIGGADSIYTKGLYTRLVIPIVFIDAMSQGKSEDIIGTERLLFVPLNEEVR